jgi:hypothetical protein
MIERRISFIGILLRACCVGIFAAALLPCAAESQPFSETRRAEQIRQIKDGLNSPSSTTRIVTFEHAMAMKDATLRRVALSTAFVSADPDLRSVALAGAVSSSSSFIVRLTGNDHSADTERLLKTFGPVVEVEVQRFDRASNTFQTLSNISTAGTQSASNGLFPGHTGAVSGERLSFAFNLNRIFTGSGCSGAAVLQGGSTLLQGTMTCNGGGYGPGNFTIVIDILK